VAADREAHLNTARGSHVAGPAGGLKIRDVSMPVQDRKASDSAVVQSATCRGALILISARSGAPTLQCNRNPGMV